MNRFTGLSMLALLVAGLAALLIVPRAWSRPAAAQDAPAAEAAGQDRELAAQQEELERRVDEIRRQIDRAEREGDAERVRELRREGEVLLDRLESLERARQEPDEDREREGGEEWERHVHEMEIHRMELEIERLHQELHAARLETSVRLAHIAHEPPASIAYAVAQAAEHPDHESAVEFLMEMREQVGDDSARRLISHHLASLLQRMDRPEEARRVLRDLILGE